MEYRVEDKYLITEDKWAYIENRLKEVCMPDIHGTDGTYLIRSVYYDDMYDTCLKENEDGTDNREKFRIRIYDLDDSTIKLELKSKMRGFTRKRSMELSLEQASALLKRNDVITDMPVILSGSNERAGDRSLIKKLVALMQYRRMQPVVMIEYERKAYTYPIGNVRITFDKNIGCSRDWNSLWDMNAQIIPVMPAGEHVLEVKYDELLPDYIKDVLDIGSLRRQAYSKYCYGRKVIDTGGNII